MADVIKVKCSKCGQVLKAPESARGRKVTCSGCGHAFKIAQKKGVSRGTAPTSGQTGSTARTRRSSSAKTVGKTVATGAVVTSFDEVEVVDSPTASATRQAKKARPKPPPRPKNDVVDDFDEVDDFGYDDYDEDYGSHDDRGPSRPRRSSGRTPGRKKRGSRGRASDTSQGGFFDSTVLGGLLSILGGIALCVLGFFGIDRRGGMKALLFGAFLVISGIGAVIKGLVSK